MQATVQIEPRKLPTQGRAKATVDTILRATAHVLATEGYAKASTNRVAEVAGVSVGSLYQYFPNKDALVLAVAEDHSRVMLDLLMEVAGRYRDGSLSEGVRHLVAGMIKVHAIDPALHRALLQQLLHLGLSHFDDVQGQVRALVAAWLEVRRNELQVADTRITAFVLVAAVESVVHAAVFEDPALLKEQAFEDEIVRLILRLLGVGESGE